MAAIEAAGETDDWYTPRYIFDGVGGPRHVPTLAWYYADSLSLPWYGFVWMNPPFGHQSTKRRWLKKFFDHGNGIALVPDRTSAPWFQEYGAKADAICWVAPKIKFERPDGSLGMSPGTGTALFACGRRAVEALLPGRLGFVTMIAKHCELT